MFLVVSARLLDLCFVNVFFCIFCKPPRVRAGPRCAARLLRVLLNVILPRTVFVYLFIPRSPGSCPLAAGAVRHVSKSFLNVKARRFPGRLASVSALSLLYDIL